jgi:bifunctional pyridoxal-dependent enzyme with beta-cystathionase and maltose regulon repressor activities
MGPAFCPHGSPRWIIRWPSRCVAPCTPPSTPAIPATRPRPTWARSSLLRGEHGWAPDLAAIERAYASGARAHLLCSPQNPTGLVYPRAALERIAELAHRHGVLVVADEIHAPLTLPGATHVPFPTVSDAARRRSIVVTSASKTWNLAGLKAAVMVASEVDDDVPDAPRAILARVPPDTPFHAGHLGVLLAPIPRRHSWPRARSLSRAGRSSAPRAKGSPA